MAVFLLLKLLPQMSPLLGLSGLFVFHSVITLLSVIFAYRFMTETRNKTLSQLCQIYTEEKKSNGGYDNEGMDVEAKEELAEEKDRMLSDCTDQTVKVRVDLKSSHRDRKNSDGGKREKISPPVGSAVISGPLEVCLSLGSEWKRRYLTLVEDSLYVWTSHR